MTNIGFAGFQGLCGTKTYALEVNPNCLDNNPPTFFKQISWYYVDEAHKLYMPAPARKHINLAGCFAMDCGGFINALWHDTDGTLTGFSGASVIARAEDLSPKRSNNQPTPYRIPAKMLYHPWPSDRRRRLQELDDDEYQKLNEDINDYKGVYYN